MEDNALKVDYIGSYKRVSECPSFLLPEYCFIGRSNVGKSSIINLVTGRREIARTSKKPGKTQSINLFKVHEVPEWIIADLPGYGFAQVSRSTRRQWSTMIEKYILERKDLMCTFLLIDIRHPRQENDRAFMNFLGANNIPFCILFTKSDKLKPVKLQEALDTYSQAVLQDWESMPTYFITSSIEKKGREEVLGYIHEMNNTFANQLH